VSNINYTLLRNGSGMFDNTILVHYLPSTMLMNPWYRTRTICESLILLPTSCLLSSSQHNQPVRITRAHKHRRYQ
jgi:hypothetical protein